MPAYRNKNCRLRLLMSIVSMSITWMSLKPHKARLLRISQPRPPAPMHKILQSFLRNLLTWGRGSVMWWTMQARGERGKAACRLSRGELVGICTRTWVFKYLIDMVIPARPIDAIHISIHVEWWQIFIHCCHTRSHFWRNALIKVQYQSGKF